MARNHRRFGSSVLAAFAGATMLIGVGMPVANAADTPVKADINVNRIDGLSNDFIGGADVSSMLSLEESGVTFRDAAGNATDLFKLLKDNGWNWVRLRVWNDPFTADGQGYGAGNVNADRAKTMAKRATDAGLRVLVDFHYSDFWADPGKQQVPKAWKSFEGDVGKTSDAVYDYTKETLIDFQKAGVGVGMVQIGNETSSKIAGISGWENMAKVFNAGSKAVREVYQDAKVAIHFTNPEKKDYLSRAANLAKYDVDYDVFASSYYPFWHGTPENLTKQLKAVAEKYHKDVMCAETSWAYTLEDGDGDSNTVPKKVATDDLKTYDISAQGQADEFRAVSAAINNVGDNDGDGSNDGLGVFYWEPAWLPVGTGGKDNAELVAKWNTYGGGWATEAAGEYDPADAGENWGGSGVDNQALFAFDGTALPSLATPKYLHTGAVTGHVFDKITPVEITVEAEHDNAAVIEAVKKQLPSEVTAEYKDGVDETEPVTWNSDAVDWIRGAGTYVITGSTQANHDATATITVKAVPATNYVTDGSFEDEANDANWIIEGDGAALEAKNPSEGKRSFAFWSNTDYEFSLTRTITGLEPGEYVLTAKGEGAYVEGNADDNPLTISATSEGKTATGAFALTGWNQWSDPQVSVTVGDSGSVTIVIAGDLAAEDWGSVDEVNLTKKAEVTEKPSVEVLVAAIDKAKAVDRSQYTNDSLDELDKAVESANVLLAGSAYTAEDVSAVAKLVDDAIAGLAQKEVASLGVDPKKTEYYVGESIADADLEVRGNYAGGMGAVTLTADQYILEYDFSKAGDAVSVKVTLKANPSISETYSVKVVAKDAGDTDDGTDDDGTDDGGNTDDGNTGGDAGDDGNTGDDSNGSNGGVDDGDTGNGDGSGDVDNGDADNDGNTDNGGNADSVDDATTGDSGDKTSGTSLPGTGAAVTMVSVAALALAGLGAAIVLASKRRD